MLLGVPRSELDAVKGWSDEMALFIGSSRLSADKYRRAQSGMREMAAYFKSLIAARRARPEDDLMSAMLGPAEYGDVLSEDELVAACSLLLFAGHETTTNLIGNGLWALLRHPDELRRLLGEPQLIEDGTDLRQMAPDLDDGRRLALREAAAQFRLGQRAGKHRQALIAQCQRRLRGARASDSPHSALLRGGRLN